MDALTFAPAAPAAPAATLPIAFRRLMEPHRYKVLFGGRGGSKSWSVAIYLLMLAACSTKRVLCAREFQSSMKDSVHKLLADTIASLGLSDRFEVGTHFIRGYNGSEFLFEGLKTNVTRIKSFEGIDIAWVEEAQNVSDSSWQVLIPTIRKDGSEIIVTFNPVLETDATYQRFIVNPPPDAVLIACNYHDNPWFPATLRREMLDLKERDPDAFQHVYLGQCRHSLDGAIFARELREAAEADRIRAVPYDPSKPVHVYFDLGWADNTAMWFAQHIAGEIRLIDFHQDHGYAWPHYLQVLQQRGYVIGTVFLPHDAEATQLGTGRSIEEITRAAGWRVQIVPKLDIVDGISAVRMLFPTMFFDRDRCADGIQALRHYRYKVDPDTGQYSREPLHDNASHASDALRYCAVAMQGHRQAHYEPPDPRHLYTPGDRSGTSWMSR